MTREEGCVRSVMDGRRRVCRQASASTQTRPLTCAPASLVSGTQAASPPPPDTSSTTPITKMAMEFASELIATARAIASPGKGILAADESTGTIGKRFAQISVENNQDNRRAYRELLFRTEGEGLGGCSFCLHVSESFFFVRGGERENENQQTQRQ